MQSGTLSAISVIKLKPYSSSLSGCPDIKTFGLSLGLYVMGKLFISPKKEGQIWLAISNSASWSRSHSFSTQCSAFFSRGINQPFPLKILERNLNLPSLKINPFFRFLNSDPVHQQKDFPLCQNKAM